MAALREFDKRGGLIGVGDDAGFLYSLYGFGLIREMELQQEAGFPTLKVIQHATANNAKILGQENEDGQGPSAVIWRTLPSFPAENLSVIGRRVESLSSVGNPASPNSIVSRINPNPYNE